MFVGVQPQNGCRVNPSVASPDRKRVGQRVSNPGPQDTLIESIGVIQETSVAIEPPFPFRTIAITVVEFPLGEQCEPEPGVFDILVGLIPLLIGLALLFYVVALAPKPEASSVRQEP